MLFTSAMLTASRRQLFLGSRAWPQGPGEALRSREWLRSTRSFCASQSSHPGSRELNAPHAASNPTHPQCFWRRLAGVGGG